MNKSIANVPMTGNDQNDHPMLTQEYYVWFKEQIADFPLEYQTIRIVSDCLGNAAETARLLASVCNINIIGVAPDLGVCK
jgi:hypothetical protein